MNIDDSMIKSYLVGKDDYKSHWLFNSILDKGEYTFDRPRNEYKEKYHQYFSNIRSSTIILVSHTSPSLYDLVFLNIIIAKGAITIKINTAITEA